MPNFAVRVDVAGRGSFVYSSDTRPCETVVALARGVDTLVHEATYSERDPGRAGGHAHSTAAEAGEVAARAGVRRLILTHIGAEYHDAVDALARRPAGGLRVRSRSAASSCPIALTRRSYRETKRFPAIQKRRRRSRARVMPMRGPARRETRAARPRARR